METQEDYFTIQFSKGSSVLEFKCCAHTGLIEVDKISVVNDKNSPKQNFFLKFSELEAGTKNMK